MSSIPNLLIIFLAVATYGLLAFLIMRFALRSSQGSDLRYVRRQRPRAIPIPESSPVYPVLSVLEREAALDQAASQCPAHVARPPDAPAARVSQAAD